MASNSVTFFHDPPRYGRKTANIFSLNEKCCLGFIRSQNFHHLWRILGMWAIVKRQIDMMPRSFLNDGPAWQERENKCFDDRRHVSLFRNDPSLSMIDVKTVERASKKFATVQHKKVNYI